MALFSSLKRLFFGAKAVTRSAADKAVDSGKQAGKDIAHSAEDIFGKALGHSEEFAKNTGRKARELGEDVYDKASDLAEKAVAKSGEWSQMADDLADPSEDMSTDEDPANQQETASDPEVTATKAEDLFDEPVADDAPLYDEMDEASPLDEPQEQEDLTGKVEQVGKKVIDTGNELADKAGDVAGKVGGVLLEKGGDALDKFGETSEKVGEKIFEKGGEAMEHAKKKAEEIGSKLREAKDELMAKAQEEAAKSGDADESIADTAKRMAQQLDDMITGNNEEFADKPIDTGGSELEKHDSFWEKADKYAEGDYHMKGKQPKEGDMTIKDDPDYKPPEKGKVKGFEDQDGDGDELIDDAIVE